MSGTDIGRAERDETYPATRLHLSDIPGTVQVRVGDSPTMRVQVSGPARLVEQVRREVLGGVLHVSGPRGGGGVTVVSRHGRVQTNVFGGGMSVVGAVTDGSVVMGGGGVRIVQGAGDVTVVDGEVVAGPGETVITGTQGMTILGSGVVIHDGDAVQVAVTVDVPPHTPVTVDESIAGRYYVGDIEGPLDLRLKGSGGATAGRVAATRIDLSGSGHVEVTGVVGRELRVRVSGAGSATVREGQVDGVDASVSGTGSITFGGSTRRADLSVSGVGNIHVNQVTEAVFDRVSGLGRIYVHGRPQGDPDTLWS